uniref:RING-type domain-containing protein n=1 Tax=Parascaris univalens TaxID=6257 RepID=A0A914ZXK7_PARUN
MMSSDGLVVVNCRVCGRDRNVVDMHQFVPCLHIFCNDCVKEYSTHLKDSVSIDGLTKQQNITTCLQAHCYSQMRPSSDQVIVINKCDNDMCSRKLSMCPSQKLSSCVHELCETCLEEIMRRANPSCPVETCGEPITESEDQDNCDVCGKQLVESGYVTTKCCQARLCPACFEWKFSRKISKFPKDENVRCEEGTCVPRKLKRSFGDKGDKDEEPAAQCKGQEGCDGTPLNGFPSNGECDHDVCPKCLEKMIDECQSTGMMPMCPNGLCRQPYNVDSVIALKALMPHKCDFFANFALENQGYDAIKDDAVTFIDITSDFDVDERMMEVKVETDGGEESDAKVIFDKKGTVADFIREVRRTLKILPLDKVYGYYIRRGGEKTDDKKADEEMTVNAASVTTPISELLLTPDSAVIVDMSGIVQAKVPAV